MIAKVLKRYQKINSKSGNFAKLVLTLLKFLSNTLGRKNDLDISRFCKVNRLSFAENDNLISSRKTVGLILVAGEKDFELLNFTLTGAINSLDLFFKGDIRVIVPDKSVELCQEALRDFKTGNVEVISENDSISFKARKKIKDRFHDRYGWALQQFLKVSEVIRHADTSNLVLDADTLLLQKRKWLDADFRQCLLPTWEFNRPYYDLLSQSGLCSKTPSYTFVPHHMIMQEKFMSEAMAVIGVSNLEDLVDFVVENAEEGESTFCIEYELYAQYLFNFRPKSFFLDKWSNLGIPRYKIRDLTYDEIFKRYSDYASISAHSYIN